MKRSLFGALAAAALLASPAVAQDAEFKVDVPGYNAFLTTGQFTQNYAGGIPAGIATGSSFDIFCVQINGSTNGLTTPYDVFITEVESGADFSNTSKQSYDRYWRTAWIIENWFDAGQPLPGAENNWQWAVWMAADGVTTQAGCDSYAGVGQCAGSWGILQAAYAADINTYLLKSTWWVISDAGDNCTRLNGNATECQEFIFYDPSDPPQEIVPEPATMTLLATGLAGMAAANRRRKKQK